MKKDYKKGVRDPSSHRTPEQIRAMDHGYNHSPEMIRRRSHNNSARGILAKEGLVHKGDGKDVAHIRALDRGGGNDRSNLKVDTQKHNRGWRRYGAQPK